MAEIWAIEAAAGVAFIRWDIPPHNAFSPRHFDDLMALFDRFDLDESIGCVVLMGSGRIFCSGANLRDVNAALMTGKPDPRELLARLSKRVATFRTPVVAAINGHAAGGGFDLALHCDLRLAAEQATFAASAINMGLAASWHRLPRLIGLARATEMLLTGQPYEANRMADWGLVMGVHSAAELAEAAISVAGRIASRPPLARQTIVEATRVALDTTIAEADEALATSFRRLVETADHRTAVEAFFARRDPDFRGRGPNAEFT